MSFYGGYNSAHNMWYPGELNKRARNGGVVKVKGNNQVLQLPGEQPGAMATWHQRGQREGAVPECVTEGAAVGQERW